MNQAWFDLVGEILAEFHGIKIDEEWRMNRSELRQIRMHVEKLRRAADLLDGLLAAHEDTLSKIDFAKRGLKNIQAIAMVNHNGVIADRARDTLMLMGINQKEN